MWANYQASKGFEIVIINDVKDAKSGKKFHLLFVSNDKITQIVLSTSKIAETVLYPDDRKQKKPVTSVTIRLTNQTMAHQQVVVDTQGTYEYVLHISSSLMEEKNVEKAVVLAVQRGMTRVWLWNGEGGTPDELIDGIVEFVNVVGGHVGIPDYRLKRLPVVDNMCWKYGDHMDMAHFLRYCETMKNGFIERLNQAMESSWHDSMVDDALGMPAWQLCGSYYSL
ncbi:hypothetical protein IFM89_006141 [Coptis chinensis]|uniref:Uncharacterized protein n=1 Tax=Coptis chinensis TaxID=261450 RepID=A0A835LCY0_9MAGN|nr:hypothetical protein IFM89_006141 [Coptis chinensis]